MTREFDDFVTDLAELPALLNSKDVAKVFRVSRSRAYQLMENFPRVKIGETLRIRKEDFIDWISKNVKEV